MQGHPTSSKAWMAKLVCSHIFVDQISKEHKILSNGGEKDIRKYRAALSNVFEVLNEEEMQTLEDNSDRGHGLPEIYE
ncbi:hypothetical protein PILCRDRAFT_14005 [Piloderma croceum F 1598]|uniref:Uncharacterized protein n=1 Tax=Piloderma croceum (strain F 1598) TaxID=765440 RepID=A0A0C3F4W2_PILCF|nr:hypothetical protein PILCRDRAFT_14005 [Piloderma croceum F 1598]